MQKTEAELAAEAAAAEAQAQADAEAAAAAAASSSIEEIDYKALAEAEKARADAAELLIIKNKNIEKRQTETPTGLTEERVLELIKTAIPQTTDETPEAKALAEAQANLKIINAKNAEIARALQAKQTVKTDGGITARDGEPKMEPKLPDGSPLKDFKYVGNGVYSKKLDSGKTMFKDTKAQGGDRKTWVE